MLENDFDVRNLFCHVLRKVTEGCQKLYSTSMRQLFNNQTFVEKNSRHKTLV